MTLANKKAIEDIKNIEHLNDADAHQVVLIGKTTGGNYVPIKLNDNGSI